MAGGAGTHVDTDDKSAERGETDQGEKPPTAPKRFYANAKLNASRMAGSAGQIGDEVVQHLNALVGADVEVTIEIHASVPEGIPDTVVRTVSENARTLKFEHWGFEEE